MVQTIVLGDITAEVVLKDIKNIHLSVYPPLGDVRIAAPLRMNLETIRIFAISKLGWIKQQQKKILGQQRESQREFVNRESHYFKGKRYLLKVVEVEGKPTVFTKHTQLVLQMRPNTSLEQRQVILQEWYRDQLKAIVPKYIAKWEKILEVKVGSFGIKKMKTKWGTCNPAAQRIWINLELAKKPLDCLEYIIVHEMVHLLERHHNERFVAYMNTYLPQWGNVKNELNRLPVGYVAW